MLNIEVVLLLPLKIVAAKSAGERGGGGGGGGSGERVKIKLPCAIIQGLT